jgi:hypothetical protein
LRAPVSVRRRTRSRLSAALTALILLVAGSAASAQTSKGFIVLNHPTFGPGTGDVLDPTFNDPRHRH